MRPEDIAPEEEIIPPNLMWYQRKGCLMALAIFVLILIATGIFSWQVYKYYKAVKTGVLPPEMKELLGEISQEDKIDIVSRDDDPAMGPEEAAVVVIAFEDFKCPISAAAQKELEPVLAEYQDRVLFVYRDYPVVDELSAKAAEAADCANEQNNFWTYHDLLFQNQSYITSEEALVSLANKANLDVNAFKECLNSDRYQDEIAKDLLDGSIAGVKGTPTFFINGHMIEGNYPAEFWRQTFDYLLQNKQ